MSELPSQWVSVALDDMCSAVTGSVNPETDVSYELYSVPALPTDAPEIALGAAIGSAKRPVAPDDVLLCKINPRINRVWIVRSDKGHRQLASTEFIPLRLPKGMTTTARYLMWYLRSPRFRSWIKLNAEGATGSHTRAKSPQILRQVVPLAPVGEQRRIVAAIEEHFYRIDAGVEALERIRQNLTRMRTAVLARAVQGWPETPLEEISQVFVGSTPSRSRQDFWGGKIPWVSSGEVAFSRIRQTRETITELGLGSTTRLHPPGTVLLAMIGEGKTRGQAAILDVAAAHNQNSAAIRLDKHHCLPEWLFYVLMARYEETRRSSSGGSQPALNSRRVRAVLIPLPAPDQQRRLVGEIEQQLSLIGALAAETDRALSRGEALRAAILELAFTGKLVPQDPRDEPASVLLERISIQRGAPNGHESVTARRLRSREVTA